MGLNVEELKTLLPYYLTEDKKSWIARELKAFPEKFNYYTSQNSEEFLQGDGGTQVEIFRFDNGNRRSINGMLISNSCDISKDNERVIPSKAIFASLVSVDSYEKLLQKSGMEKGAIADKLDAIRAQKVTSMFFLPKGCRLETDHVAILDDLHSIPSDHYLGKNPQKLFSLSSVGFYLLVMKLSIHFCRMHEEVDRTNPTI